MTISEYIKKHTKHKEYVERRQHDMNLRNQRGEIICMVPTTDEWYPNYDGDFVQVSLLKLRNSPKESEWRVCVWGADDHGLEIDTDRATAVILFMEISNWKDCTHGKLKKLGFVTA